MNELQIFNNPEFGTVRTMEEYGKVLFCGSDVAKDLGYASPKDAISAHTKGAVKRRILTNGGKQEMLFIPESDLYRLVFSSKLPTAEKFTDWVTAEVLPAIRKTGGYSVRPMTGYQQMMASTRQKNARIQSARILAKLAENYKGTSFEQVLNAHVTKELTGEYLIPLPELKERTYTAAEVGKRLGISGHMVGRITNRNGMKTSEYGEWFKDMSRGGGKEVSSFRYYESVIPAIKNIMEQSA